MSKNDITGDRIISKKFSKKFDEGFDRIFGSKPIATEIIIIAAVARNNVIGHNNSLPWAVPDDMARFKAMTQHHTVVMGRKTWESLPNQFRPLALRRNIVISRQLEFQAPGAEVVQSLEQALELANGTQKVFIIGGAQVYAQALPLAHTLEITRIDQSPHGDALFPEIPKHIWYVSAETLGCGCSFLTYKRQKDQ